MTARHHENKISFPHTANTEREIYCIFYNNIIRYDLDFTFISLSDRKQNAV